MLEAAGFDFRSRYPQKLVIKLLRASQLDHTAAGKTAYSMCLDIYRTFGPLKQTTPTIAIACVELAARLCDADLENLNHIVGDATVLATKWGTSRLEIMG